MTAFTASSITGVTQNLDVIVFAAGIESAALPENSESLLGQPKNGTASVGKHLLGTFAPATGVFTVGAGQNVLVKIGSDNNWGLV